jgi:diacylglycerol kinase
MRDIIKKHHISFKNAFAGLIWAVKTQPNFRIHLILAFIALVIGRGLSISNVEMSIIIFTIVLGLSAEMINTSIEAMTDLITKEWREDAKIAKDVSAGMMLVVSFGATIVALFIFIPYILRFLS